MEFLAVSCRVFRTFDTEEPPLTVRVLVAGMSLVVRLVVRVAPRLAGFFFTVVLLIERLVRPI
jgi:hypothetical protein